MQSTDILSYCFVPNVKVKYTITDLIACLHKQLIT